ncbi:MAG: HAD-IA family hydrolase [Actinomycetota bacterium]|nr:HAD-IA family hydrolase [Actinomycetota bacterium]
MLGAIYGGSDDAVLVGRVCEDEWWEVVRSRLGIDTSLLRSELESGLTWQHDLIAVLREVKATTRTAILSNAWPSQRPRMIERELTDLVHELLLSCEIGCAKPDVNAFKIALERLGTTPAESLFVDDTVGHIEVAATLGIHTHLHLTTEGTIEAIRRFAGC